MQAKPSGIGQPLRRLEDLRLVLGKGSYGDDVFPENLAHAVVVRSVHAHARLLKVDVEAAKAAPGVLGAFTGKDYVADGLHPMPLKPEARTPPDIRLTNADGSGAFLPKYYPLALDRVRFVGEGIAWIVAETLNYAKSAAERVAIEYEPLPATADAHAATEDSAAILWDQAGSNVALDAQVGDAGAVARAMEGAAYVVRLDTHVPRVTGVPMEPRTAVASYDAVTGKYTLHAGAGSVTQPKSDLIAMLGVGEDQVRVIARDIGGNFGTRNSSYPEFALAAWSAKRLSRPVKWVCERSEAFLTDFHGRDMMVQAELALDQEGNFLALRASNLSNLGAYPVSHIPLTKGTELMSSLYRIPVACARARAVLSNSSPTVPYRSAGRPEAMFVIERLIDMAAQRHNFDRIELRRKNLISRNALPCANPYGMHYDSGDYPGVFDQALELSDFTNFAARRIESKTRGRERGIGVGCYIESASGYPRERALVTVQPGGRIEVVIGTLSTGQGHETSFAQLLGEYLGVPADSVLIVTGDTDLVKEGGGSHSGRSMRHAGTTISVASKQIIAKGKAIAAHVLEAALSDIAFANAQFSVAGTDRRILLFEIARLAREHQGLPADLRGPLSAVGEVDSRVASFPYGAHVCEVEVDPATCEVFLVRYTAVDDVGRAVNPMILHGQAHGGIVQGYGEALIEHLCYADNGQLISGSFMDYAMPRASDLPRLDTAISEVPSTTHPLGMRGGGEGGISPALAALVNAVVDALSGFGIEHIEMPVTPERVWRTLKAVNIAPHPDRHRERDHYGKRRCAAKWGLNRRTSSSGLDAF
jgi:carbon-monoxide dehydrogenase large subunit